MLLGILSDTHGGADAVRAALSEFRERNVERILHCGDIDDADTVLLFDGWLVHFVYGNCDWDRPGIRAAIEALGATLHEPFGHLEIDGKQIAWVHGDNSGLLRDLEWADAYDFLFYGHTHVAEQHKSGKTLVVNPGALHRARPKSCVTLNPATGELKAIVID